MEKKLDIGIAPAFLYRNQYISGMVFIHFTKKIPV